MYHHDHAYMRRLREAKGATKTDGADESESGSGSVGKKDGEESATSAKGATKTDSADESESGSVGKKDGEESATSAKGATKPVEEPFEEFTVPAVPVTRQPSLKSTMTVTMVDAVTANGGETSPPIPVEAGPPAKKKPKRGDSSGTDSKDPAAPPKDEKDAVPVIATPATAFSDNSQETVEIVGEGDASSSVEWKPLTPAFKILFALTGLLLFAMIVGIRNCLIKRALIAKAESLKPEYDQLLPKDGRERDIEAGSGGADEEWGEDWEDDDYGNSGDYAGQINGNSDQFRTSTDASSMPLIKPRSGNSKDLQTSPSSSISSLAPGYSHVGKATGRSVNGSSSSGHDIKRSGSNDEIELSKLLSTTASTANESTSFKDLAYSSGSSSEYNSSDSSPLLLSTTMASSSSHFASTKAGAIKGGLGLGKREGEDRTQVAPAIISKKPPPTASDTDFFAVNSFSNNS